MFFVKERKVIFMMASEAYFILSHHLSELPQPLRDAVEFTLANWGKIKSNAKEIHNYSMSLEDLPGEEWRDVIGYEGLYQVSNMGRVKSFCEQTARILSPCPNKKGYYMVHLHKDGKKKNFGIHVLVATAFIPNPENKPEVNHLDRDKTNNRADNLEWNTGEENKKHARETNPKEIKQRKKQVRLTEDQIHLIRQICIPGDSIYGIAALARMFDVHEDTISRIVQGKSYKNVK